MPNNSFYCGLPPPLKKAVNLFKQGHYKTLWQEFLKRVYSSSSSLGLQRDLTKGFNNPDARIDIAIRPLEDRDVEELMDHGHLAQNHPRLADYQKGLINSGLSTCYVAVTKNDNPCYMQFLIGSKQNSRLKKQFGSLFPKLDKNEALLEGAYMRPSFRGKRIMPAAMARIASKAKELDVRWVLTFVHVDNIPSLKGCKRAGFAPYTLRKERWFLFQHFVTFHDIPPEIRARYYRATTDKKRPPMINKNKDGEESKPAIGTDPAE